MNEVQNVYATTEYNLSLMKKYTKGKESGVFLLPSPTGSGKTYAITDYINENIEKKVFVYVIPVKTNLIDFKKKLLEKIDKKYHEKVLVLKSMTDELLEWYSSAKHENIYDSFSSWSEYKKVLLLLKSYDGLKQTNSLHLFNYIDFSSTASSFIYRIKKEYKKYTKNNNLNSSNLLKKDALEIFKSLNILKYSIVLTTTSKISRPIGTISESKYIWEFDHFRNSTIFLDEFDSQKRYFIDTIIKDSLYTKIDLLELFRIMADTFKNMSYKTKFNYKEDEFIVIKAAFLKIYEDRQLKYVIDTELINKELDFLPILLNSSFNSINLQTNKKRLFININKKEEYLEIVEEETENSYSLSDLLKEISQVIKRYIVFCQTHIFYKSVEYREINAKTQINIEEFVNAKIHDSIKIFGVGIRDLKYKYLSNQIKNGILNKKKLKKSLAKSKWNFYQNGFSFINISKTYLDSNISDLEYFNLSNTPESMIIDISQKCMIIGISATANMNTVIKNFDIDYLKNETNFDTLSHNEIKKMQDLYLDSKRQGSRNFNVAIINDYSTKKEKIREFCKRNFSSCLNEYSYLESSGIKENVLNYYMNFVDCFRVYLFEEKIQSMLYFSSRYIQDKDSKEVFNYKMLFHLLIKLIENIEEKNAYIKFLKQEVQIYSKNKDLEGLKRSNLLFFQYDSNNEEYYEEYLKTSLKRKRKVFLYANYSRIGTGKNLEYTLDGLNKKDFDAVFLEKPTNIIQRAISTDEEKILGIYQIENLFKNYVLNKQEYKRKLYALVQSNISPGIYSKSNDNIEASMLVIIQAIGRLHRTNTTTDMFIFLDNNLIDIVNSFANINIPLLPSLIKVKEICENSEHKSTSLCSKSFINEINGLTGEFNRLIKYSLEVFKNPMNLNNLEELKTVWNNIRDFVLKFPSINDNDESCKLYFKDNNICHVEGLDTKYTVYQRNDFKQIELEKVANSYEVEVSEKAANLHLIRNCNELKEFALKNNISLEFKYKKLMIPIVFNNIYKGALGEKIGKYIIEKYCDVQLEELDGTFDERYESFDYKNERSKLYVDFKYYSMQTLKHSRNEVLLKAKYKLETNRLEKALIINIFGQTKKSQSILDNKDNVIFIPYLVNSENENKPFIDISMINIVKEVLNGK